MILKIPRDSKDSKEILKIPKRFETFLKDSKDLKMIQQSIPGVKNFSIYELNLWNLNGIS